MKNPLNHDEIEKLGIKGLGDDPSEALLAYVYYVESQCRHEFENLKNVLPIHDRLLESTLVVFDAMSADKNSLRKLHNEIALSPCLLKDFIPAARGFFMRMFMTINLDEGDFTSSSRLHLYTVYFNYWLSIWLTDETTDQSNTMAAIDQNLRQLKGWKEWICKNTSYFG